MATPTANTTLTTRISVSGPSLVGGVKWGAGLGQGVALTYSFPGYGGGLAYATPNYGSEFAAGWYRATATHIAAFEFALARWAAVANLTFTRTSDGQRIVGELRLAFTDSIGTDRYAHAYTPGSTPQAGDVWFRGASYNDAFVPGTYGFMTMLHEVGHALGFKHPFTAPALPLAQNTTAYTVMAYREAPFYTLDGLLIRPSTPMDGDIRDMQRLYGPNKTYHTGNDTYSFSVPTVMTIWDAGGTDTLSAANQTNPAIINLGAKLARIGPFASGYNIHIYKTVVIEHATGGSGSDLLTGSTLANRLSGGAGNDTLIGAAGNDVLIGGSGNDRLRGDAGNDVLYLAGIGGDSASGGTGNDRFVFGEVRAGKQDVLTDFTSADELAFARAVFPTLGATGPVAAAMFLGEPNPVPHTASQHLLYDTATGVLSYDSDGDGAAVAVVLAVLQGRPSLGVADLLVV